MAETIITKEQVKKVSKLVKLNLSEIELEQYAEKFTDTLKYINVLSELDTENVPETYQVTGLSDVFQTSENTVTLPKEKAIANASKATRNLFVTEGVFDRE
jgi:aspartyl-tRNA(Asn)/glutamyl-tRNA(Gln) amidotransferase subunit C